MNKGKLIFAQAMEHVQLSIYAIAKNTWLQTVTRSLGSKRSAMLLSSRLG